MRVSVVIPWLDHGCAHRRRALDYVIGCYRASGLPVQVAQITGQWSKGAALARADTCDVDVVVVADGDVWCDHLDDAIASCRSWAVPHAGVFRLDEPGTARFIAGDVDPYTLTLDQRPYRGTVGGGIVILRREILADVPLDPRFTGWGQEDESWGIALRALHGPPYRGSAPLWHLWHPPQQRMSRGLGNPAGVQLRNRYQAARRDRVAMRALIEEAREHT